MVLGCTLAVCGPAHREAAADADPDGNGWELKPAMPGAEPVAAEKRLPGIYPAGSKMKDPKALGGFGPCDNYPFDLGGKDWGTKDALSLVAFPKEPVAYFKHQGIALRLINRTGETTAFEACDSSLYIVQEALDKQGRWREIEALPTTRCGNSFHRVFLKPDQYWQFPARVYAGPIKTKIRFRLDPGGEQADDKSIYSNEFEGFVAEVQFRKGPDQGALKHALRSDDPKAALSVLCEALDDEDGGLRRSAACKIAEFGAAAGAAIPALLVAMKGEDKSLRATAAYALWCVDNQQPEAIKTLLAALADKDDDRARWQAAYWLRAIGPATKEVIPALCAALGDSDTRLRAHVAETLGILHAKAEVAVPALAATLKDPDWFVRSYAAHALAQFGKEAAKAIPALGEALKDKDGHVKVAAAKAIWKIEGKVDRAVPVLIETLKDFDESHYAAGSAAEMLGKIGPSAKAAVPDLTAMLQSGWRDTRIAAAFALCKITGKAEPGLAVLIKALEDRRTPNESGTHSALTYLEEIGPQAKAAVPVLLAILKDGGDVDRHAAAQALKKIDPDAASKAGIR
jgi:HEAT repeat protein